MKYRFNRLELAGSLGDLGVLLPMALGMIMVNGLDARGVFLSVGLFYIASGMYFGVTTPVQPMKVIGSYAIAMGLAAPDIYAAGLCIGVLLVIIGWTGYMDRLGKYVPKPAIRGIQLSTGLLLMAQGAKFALGTSKYQELIMAAEPFLKVHTFLGIPIGWLLAVIALLATLFFMNSKRFPAGLVVVCLGLLAGLALGADTGAIAIDPQAPGLLPRGFPSLGAIASAMVVLALPQLPMTLGNAVIANADLARDYFGDTASKTTYKTLCISMGLANLGGFLLGGMPMCHGAGGLAAHYRFGARTAGSNLIIGAVFVVLVVLLGDTVIDAVRLIPFSVLGVLLLFAGGQLAMTVMDVKETKALFVCLVVVGVALASNLAVGFVAGVALHYLLRSERFNI